MMSRRGSAAQYQEGVARIKLRHKIIRAQLDEWKANMRLKTVLIVDDDESMRVFLRDYIESRGGPALVADNPIDALQFVESQAEELGLVLTDVRMPTSIDGRHFVEEVRMRWPTLPVVVLTGFPDDIADLMGTAIAPILVIAKPIWSEQIDHVLELALA